MARHLFGGIADYVVSVGAGNAATLQPGAAVTCWNMSAGGAQYGDLLASDGVTPIDAGTLTTNASGSLPEFYGPDNVSELYLDANGGSGPRRRTTALDYGADITGIRDALADHVGSDSDPHGDRAYADVQVATRVASKLWRRRDVATSDPGVYAEAFTATAAQSSSQPAATIGWRPPLVALSGAGDAAEKRAPWSYVGTLESDLALSGATAPGNAYVVSTALQPHTIAQTNNSWGVRFRTRSQRIYLRVRYMAASDAVQILVNGARLWDLPRTLASLGAGAPGNSHIVTVDLGTSKAREIQVELAGSPFYGVYTAADCPIVGAPHTGPHLLGFGDSITGGANGVNVAGAIGTWLHRLGHRLRCSRVTNSSRGGTGFTAANTGQGFTPLTDPARYQADVIAKAPDICIVWAGYNDDGSASSETTWKDAVDTVLQQLTAQLPGAHVVLVGTHSPTGAWGSFVTPPSLVLKDTWARDRAKARGVPFISPITGDVCDGAGNVLGNLGQWIVGSGHVTEPSGFGSADWAIGSATDAVHLTDAGHEHVAGLMHDALLLTLTP